MILLNNLDISIIALYFILIFAIAWIATKHEKKNMSSEDYFLGGRDLHWFLIGASLFASNIGSEHLIGLAGSGAAGGVAVAQFEILACFILLLLGWFFVPFYLKSGVVTMPEFLEERYSSSARLYLSIISVIAYVLTKISITIFAGALIFETVGVEFWHGAFIVVIATGIYTIFGGLKAVIYTDTIQMIIMIGGSILLSIVGLDSIGGWSEMQRQLPPTFFSMWKSINHPEFPWTGILFGAPILGVWYWCTDQFVVQRVLSAKNITHARKGTIFGGFLKLLPLFIFVLPGMVAAVLSKTGKLNLESSNHALPALLGTILPNGMRGLVIAGLLAALMSSLSSVFNSCSTLITYDFYKKLKPETTEKKLIFVGQISTTLLVILGMLWIPFIRDIAGGKLFSYLQSVQAYISPPIAVVFLIGILNSRVNSFGAMSCLWSGFVLGISRLLLEVFKADLNPNGILLKIVNINFLHFAIILFGICSSVLLITSYLTQKDEKSVEHITVNWTTKKSEKTFSTSELIFSIALTLCVLGIWYYFS